MTEKRKEDWIHITTPDNIDKLANPSYIRKLLEVERYGTFIDNLASRVLRLENTIRDLRKPERKAKILRLLRSCQNIPHNYPWFENRIMALQYLEIIELVTEGKLEPFKSGNVRMFKLTEDGWKQE